MMKKYELTTEFITFLGRKLFRVKALVSFGDVEAGELGGYIEKESNLDQNGNAWVYGDAQVGGDARVSGNAWVYGDAQVYGNAWVYGNAQVYGNAWVYGDAQVGGDARVSGNAWVYGNAQVYGNAWVYGDAQVGGNTRVSGNAWVYGDAQVGGNADYTTIKGFGREYRTTTFFRGKDKKIYVSCGCFFGDLDRFRAKVKETHGDSKYSKEYLMIADLMEMHFTQKEE